jgi:hypothetical protein
MGVCGQADTRVAEIVGSRRSDANACSGSSRVIRLRSWRGGGGDGGGGVCPRSLSELQYSKQGAAVSQPAVKRDEPLTASRAPPACLPSLLLHTPSTHRSLTHDSLRGRRRLPPWARPATSKCSACARDGRMITRYTIWPALLTPAASIDAAKPSKGPGGRQEMRFAPMTVAASFPPRACDRALSSKQSHSVGVARCSPVLSERGPCNCDM